MVQNTCNCHHSLPFGLTEIYCQMVLILGKSEEQLPYFERSTVVKIMASSLSKPQTFLAIFSINKLYYMEYSAADTSEVQWVSTILLQIFTVVYA